MKKWLSLFFVVAVLFGVSLSAQAEIITITFDEPGIGDGVLIDDEYASLGIHWIDDPVNETIEGKEFNHVFESDGQVLWYNGLYPAGVIKLDFLTNYVSFEYRRPYQERTIWVGLYNSSSGEKVFEESYVWNSGEWDTFEYNGANGPFDVIMMSCAYKFVIDNLKVGVDDESDTDSDGDGIPDHDDLCPNDEFNDADEDGVCGDVDVCPNTVAGAIVDANGCSDSQRDTDGDGVMDDKDICPNTPVDEYGTVDANGCSGPQRGDSDNDGVLNVMDDCPDTPAGQTIDINGCAASQKDTDGDGVMDDLDNCISVPNPLQQDANGDKTGNACDSSWNKTCLITKVQKAAYLCKAIQACYLKEIADKNKDKYNFTENLKNAVTNLDNSWTKANKAKNKNKAELCYDEEDRTNAEGIITTAFDEIYGHIIDDPFCSDPSHNSDDDDNKLAANKNFKKLVGSLLSAAGKRCVSLLNAKSAYLKNVSKDAGKAGDEYSDAEIKADNAFYILKNGAAGGAWGKAVVNAGKAKPEVDSLDIPSNSDMEEIKGIIDQLVEDICNM